MSPEEITKMSYVDLMAFVGEVNRPPGGKDSVRQVVQNTFITSESFVLDVGCNTGYCSFELASLTKCKVTGVDISQNMVEEAQRLAKVCSMLKPPTFRVGDGMKLDFPDESFDLVMSGGSTAFIDDKKRALDEYARVTKPWGFIADINFFYRERPSKLLLSELNKLLGINIIPWDINYWKALYSSAGLEEYYFYTCPAKTATGEEINSYSSIMSDKKGLSRDARKVLADRIAEIMTLFSENNSLLDNGVFIYRKRPKPEQVSLFGN